MNLEELMYVSYLEARNSSDPSTQNGALLVDEYGNILGRGHNYFPPGISEGFWHGEKKLKYDRVVHAEVAAILDAAKKGIRTNYATLICGWAACSNCAKHIAAAGVKRLVRHTFEQNVGTTGNVWYEDCLIGDDIFKETGVEVLEIDPVRIDLSLLRNGESWAP